MLLLGLQFSDEGRADCNTGIDGIYFTHPLDPYRLGSICVGDGSPSDGCFDPGPVEEATWGRIKAYYRD